MKKKIFHTIFLAKSAKSLSIVRKPKCMHAYNMKRIMMRITNTDQSYDQKKKKSPNLPSLNQNNRYCTSKFVLQHTNFN